MLTTNPRTHSESLTHKICQFFWRQKQMESKLKPAENSTSAKVWSKNGAKMKQKLNKNCAKIEEK